MARFAPAAAVLAAALALGGAAVASPARDERDARLAFVRAEAVWVARADGGGARRLAAGYAPRVSPDGRRVLLLRTDDRFLYVVGAGGGAARLVTRGVNDVEWSPDSRRIAVDDAEGLAVVDLDTGRRVPLDRAPKRFGAMLGLDFSPDGRHLVWVKPVRTMGAVYAGDLYRAPVTGGAPLRLTRSGRNAEPAWGPARIAFASFPPGTDARPFDRPFRLWTVAPGGGTPARLSGVRRLVPVAWSATGRLLACFVAEFDCPPAAVDARTGAVRPLRPANTTDRQVVLTAAFSRDGRRVLVGEGVFDGVLRAVSVPYAGGAATVLARDADFPHWNR